MSILVVGVHLVGIASAAHAVMNVQSSRGAVAWSISLVTFPWIAIPLYWIFGRNEFQGYAEALRSAFVEHQDIAHQAYQELRHHTTTSIPQPLASLGELADRVAAIPFTSGNQVELLINGDETFAAMLAAIEAATDYILLQTYTLGDDRVGNAFRRALVEKAQQGVKVYLLYDGIGTRKLSRMYRQSLLRSGVLVNVFKSTKGKWNRWQINFRNHRKILIVDGAIAFVGGLNIADEYMGYKPPLSPWRDTHLSVRGAAVQCLQGSFLGDWYWATREVPEVSWEVLPRQGIDQTAFVLPTGPADRLPNCMLFFVNAINQAKHRLWLASPYFVPDDSFLAALKLAAIRGVDVRILLPEHRDHFWVYFCAFSYYEEMQMAGVKFYRYQPGFMHQKVMLIDDAIAAVGTVNLDNRSFFLNFEASVFVLSQPFIQDVEAMLLQDLKQCCLVETSEKTQPLWLRFTARVARLLAPVL
nr:cardiolipin synthase [Myxacorys almedinensis]